MKTVSGKLNLSETDGASPETGDEGREMRVTVELRRIGSHSPYK